MSESVEVSTKNAPLSKLLLYLCYIRKKTLGFNALALQRIVYHGKVYSFP